MKSSNGRSFSGCKSPRLKYPKNSSFIKPIQQQPSFGPHIQMMVEACVADDFSLEKGFDATPCPEGHEMLQMGSRRDQEGFHRKMSSNSIRQKTPTGQFVDGCTAAISNKPGSIFSSVERWKGWNSQDRTVKYLKARELTDFIQSIIGHSKKKSWECKNKKSKNLETESSISRGT